MTQQHRDIGWLIRGFVRWRALVCGVVLLALLGSVYALKHVPLDAIPDIADPQIVIYAKWQRSPALLEAQVVEPLVKAYLGTPGVESVRATSHLGYSFVYLTLNDSIRREEVRASVASRLNELRSQLPPDASVTLGPDAGSMGWVYQYAIVDRTQTLDLRELRLLNENVIKPRLQQVRGVAEVASVGGLEKQFQLKLLPPLLQQAGITIVQVCDVLRQALDEVGGRTIDVGNRDYQVRGVLNGRHLDQLEMLVVGTARDGRPVLIKDLGYFQVGYDLRRGIADLDGTGEVVGAIVVMQQGENVLSVTAAVERQLQRLHDALPDGVEIVTTYKRSALIRDTLENFLATLGYELLVVVVVIGAFLRSVRTAIAPIGVLLLATLFTVLPLAAFGQTINLLSLAGLAIAIGEMIDASIVIVENASAELAARVGLDRAQRRELVLQSIANVAPPLLFSLLIILTSFIPIFFLGARAGRLFDPLAFSKTFAMAFSTLLTLAVLPIVLVWLLARDGPAPVSRGEHPAVRVYRALLRKAIRFRYVVVAISALLLIPTAILFGTLHKDYMPEMAEGSILYMPTTLPGLPGRDAGWILQQMDRKLKAFPEVAAVFGKVGRADSATDAAPMSMIETTIMLRPKTLWRPGMTQDRLVAEMDRALQITGYVNSWTQPIAARVLMQDTGIQTAVGLKVKGPDVILIEDLAQQIEAILRDVPGTASVIAERISEGYFVDAQYDLARLAERGVTVRDAMATTRYALGGENLINVRDDAGAEIPLNVQYAPEYIDTLEKARSLPVVTSDGRTIPLSAVADVAVRQLPEMLRNDNGQLAGYVYVYVNQMTAPDYVHQAQQLLAKRLTLPAGYTLEWTGTYQYEEQARARLKVIVPLTLAIILTLLMLAFRSLVHALLVMLSVPFALIGGVLLQWALGYSLTTAVVIGYVALFAVAIQTGIIMIVFIRQALERRSGTHSYVDAVIDGSVLRLRPKLMTVAATVLSLFPIMFSGEQGMELAKPIATPTIGGMATSAIYVLVLLPCLFAIGEDLRHYRRRRRTAVV